jgi:kynurenine formamidase
LRELGWAPQFIAMETVSYIDDDNPLHTLDLHAPIPDALWVVFIHGGAWYNPFMTRFDGRRDPRQTSHDGDPLLKYLKDSKLPVSLASVNYRLSPLNQHPSHQQDVIAALEFLGKMGMREFILVGHSAGACLAFQTAHVGGCKGVIGAEGIYDMEALIEEYSEYEFFVEDAFGKDKVIWREASPVNLKYDSSLRVQLVQSTEDQLLSPRQTELMQAKLETTQVTVPPISWVKGTHGIAITTPSLFSVVKTFITQLLP